MATPSVTPSGPTAPLAPPLLDVPAAARAATVPVQLVATAPSETDEVCEALVRTVHEFASANIDALRIDEAHAIPAHVLPALAELGLFGVTLPETHGGFGLPATVACRVVAALAEHDRSVATTVGLHLGLGTRGLIAFGTEAVKARFLPKLATGEHIACFATTESGAGSDLAAIATKGVADGGVLRVSGQKIYVTNGGLASVLTMTVATPGLGDAARGTSLVVADMGTRGIERLAEEKKLGLRGSSTITIALEDAHIPLDQVLGTPGKGLDHLAHVLSWGRLLLSAGCVGTARQALRRAVAHVQERRQFGKALVAQEVVQRQLSAMAARVLGMRALVEAAARCEHDWATLARLTSSAKVLCSDGAWEVCDTSLQLHGGCGYIEETGVALPLRDARVPRIFEGANDVLLTHLGMMEIGQTSPALDTAAPSVAAALVAEHRAVLVAKHGLRVMGKKAEQHRLGVACAWRDMAEALSLLARREPNHAGLAAAAGRYALGRVRAAVQDDTPTDAALVAALTAGDLP